MVGASLFCPTCDDYAEPSHKTICGFCETPLKLVARAGTAPAPVRRANPKLDPIGVADLLRRWGAYDTIKSWRYGDNTERARLADRLARWSSGSQRARESSLARMLEELGRKLSDVPDYLYDNPSARNPLACIEHVDAVKRHPLTQNRGLGSQPRILRHSGLGKTVHEYLMNGAGEPPGWEPGDKGGKLLVTANLPLTEFLIDGRTRA